VFFSGPRRRLLQSAGASRGITTSTAAAILLLRHLGETPDDSLADWLLAARISRAASSRSRRAHPDLLSTATALHALSAMHAPLAPIREACLDFIDTLWTNSRRLLRQLGGRCDRCEYTYYALLSLGHLSL